MNKKQIAIISILTSVVVVLLATSTQWLFTSRLPAIFLLTTTVVFGIFELVTVWLLSKKKSDSNRNITLFMGLKTGKLLLSLALIMSYLLLINIDTKEFLICFVVIYFVYMAVNIFYLKRLEKNKR